ncbi:pectinesterase inhibitor 11-like [Silene latifolia]|uniref:pectinesterase inhibitor 11-like n=1 Tax=Silene latifolia TaxID=37657 RepID=UPI003D77444A
MATYTLSLFLIFLTTFVATVTATATTNAFNPASTTTNDFIKSKCSSTAYPTRCVQSLSYFATKIQKSPRQLAQTALTVSLSKARYAKTCMTQVSQSKGLRPKEVAVIKDCMEEISDAVDRLGKSVHEFQIAVRSRSRDFVWHMSNVQTWASAALTDLNTCVDEGKVLNRTVKKGIMDQFQGVMECTSNALALVNQFANKYSP